MSQLSNNDIFYNDGYKLAQKFIQNNTIDKDALFKGIKELYSTINELIDSLLKLAAKQKIPVACKKGCEWCCHQPVYANSYEVHYLSDFIKENLSNNEISEISAKAKLKNDKVKSLKVEQIDSYKSPCPVLKDGACMAYEARPMACRIYLSMKLESCLEFFNHPENEDNYPALLDFPLQAGRMMNEGFMAALKEIDIDTVEFRLEDGLSRAFQSL